MKAESEINQSQEWSLVRHPFQLESEDGLKYYPFSLPDKDSYPISPGKAISFYPQRTPMDAEKTKTKRVCSFAFLCALCG